MAKNVEVKNLSVVFGKPSEQEYAVKLLKESKTTSEIRKKTGATVAVRNVSFEIKENELFVIVGLSGSGKSSLIRTLNLLNKPTLGQIFVGEKDIMKMNKAELRNYRRNDVSMVFQHFGLLNHRNVLKNVEYSLEVQGIEKEIRTPKAMEAIKTVGLSGWEHHTPNQLSGGMKQRVGLARALTNDPELLLMDEPYSALDPLIRRQMQNELLNLEDEMDRTIVFITHDMNEAFKMGDRIALMKDGEIVQLGTPKDFLENPANDYVKSFIADVDKTRILKVRSIMRKPIYVAKPTDTVTDTLKQLHNLNRDFCYVTDVQNQLLGHVTIKDLENTKDTSIKGLIVKDNYSINRNAYIKETWKKLNDADYDIAVVDSKNRLRGVLDSEEIVKALAD